MKDVTPSELRAWRKQHSITQQKLGKQLGLKKIAMTKIETGLRRISPAEQKLVKLLMYGEMPFIRPDAETKPSELQFSKEEWAVIEKEAQSEGYVNLHDWIADKIKSYLRMNPKTQEQQLAAEARSPYNRGNR